jgi:hypothetical protein
MPRFNAEVDEHFSFLKAEGFELLESEESNSFDNGYAIFRSASLALHVVRDRSEWRFEVGALGGLRFDYQLLAELFDGSAARQIAAEAVRNPAVLAEALEHQLSGIRAAFTPDRADETSRALRRLGELRARRLFDGPSAAERTT